MWFNCVEEMVFTDDDFCSDMDPPAFSDITVPVGTSENRQKLQALQAAYHVCLYQNWEGTDAGKRRIRRHRFSTVVSVRFPHIETVSRQCLLTSAQTARDLGIDTARHMDYSAQPKHEFSWYEFVMREELIRCVFRGCPERKPRRR
jgi:hypothetical protein